MKKEPYFPRTARQRDGRHVLERELPAVIGSMLLILVACGSVSPTSTSDGGDAGRVEAGHDQGADGGRGGAQLGGRGGDVGGSSGTTGAGGAAGTGASCCQSCGVVSTDPTCQACPTPPAGQGKLCGCGPGGARLCCCFNADQTPHCSGSAQPLCP